MKKFFVCFLVVLSIITLTCCNSNPTPTPEPEPEIPEQSDWVVGDYVDEFGEKTGLQYVFATGDGTFSNMIITEGAYLRWELYIDYYQEKLIGDFKLLEYGTSPETALLKQREYTMSVKLDDGSVKKFTVYQPKNKVYVGCFDPEFIELLRTNDELKISIIENADNPSRYSFAMHQYNINETIAEAFGV